MLVTLWQKRLSTSSLTAIREVATVLNGLGNLPRRLQAPPVVSLLLSVTFRKIDILKNEVPLNRKEPGIHVLKILSLPR